MFLRQQGKNNIPINSFNLHYTTQDIYIRYITMSQANNEQDLVAIFNFIDKDQDGFISRADLQASGYAESLFQNNQNALMGFMILEDRMNQKQFALLANGYKYKMHDLAITKFSLYKSLGKYLNVSSQGQAAPSIKQSYMRLSAHNQQFLKNKQHSVGIEFGVDRPGQQHKIQEIGKVLGHSPHEVFVLFKIKTKSNGQQIAAKFQSLLSNVVAMAKEMAPQFQLMANCIKSYARYSQGYIYIVIQIENSFIDNVVNFLNQVIQAISPEFTLKFKALIKSHLKNILKESFTFEKSGGQIDIQFDIDNITLRKLKQIIGDNADPNSPVQPSQAMALLFEELKFSAKFDNLGQAASQALNTSAQDMPKPYNFVSVIKQLNLKQTIGQFFEQGPELIDLLKNNCQFEGQLSLNLQDIFFKQSFNLQIQEAFDLL